VLVLSDSSRGREPRQGRDRDCSAPGGVTRPGPVAWLHSARSSRLSRELHVPESAAKGSSRPKRRGRLPSRGSASERHAPLRPRAQAGGARRARRAQPRWRPRRHRPARPDLGETERRPIAGADRRVSSEATSAGRSGHARIRRRGARKAQRPARLLLVGVDSLKPTVDLSQPCVPVVLQGCQ
jgi:hypothetical protein